MVIHINPERVRVGSGASGRTGRRALPSSPDAPVAPARAHVNHIPAPEALRTLIANAVAALRQGMAWDRGTILNLLV